MRKNDPHKNNQSRIVCTSYKETLYQGYFQVEISGREILYPYNIFGNRHLIELVLLHTMKVVSQNTQIRYVGIDILQNNLSNSTVTL